MTNWRDLAACRPGEPDAYPEIFWPVGTDGPAKRQTRAAKAICRGCPVRNDCLTWALENAEGGIWGGKTDEERRRMRRHPAGQRTRAGAA